jgi:Phospholipid methyltransferase
LGKSFSVRPEARELITYGLYARIRNPMYVFLDLMVLGLILSLELYWLLVILAALVVFQIRRGREMFKTAEPVALQSVAMQLMSGDEVVLDDQKVRVKRVGSGRLRMVQFELSGRLFEAIEQNPESCPSHNPVQRSFVGRLRFAKVPLPQDDSGTTAIGNLWGDESRLLTVGRLAAIGSVDAFLAGENPC